MIQTDFRDPPLKAVAALSTGTRPPQIIVDHQHPCLGPAPGDAPGRGAKGGFPPEVASHVVRLACERPDPLGRSLSQWDCTELARQLIKVTAAAPALVA
jgi:hypothetical protein